MYPFSFIGLGAPYQRRDHADPPRETPPEYVLLFIYVICDIIDAIKMSLVLFLIIHTVVNNLNAAEEKLGSAFKSQDVNDEIAIQSAIKFNGGGHINHTLFWENLAPKSSGGGEKPTGELLKEIEKTWGSLDKFIEKFNTQTAAVQGSGWGWLGYNKEFKRLEIATTSNQDPLQATTGLVPLLGIDVWEHAYYLQYKNVRPDYLKAVWEVVNWKTVADRFNKSR
ncbi:Superoxide dismutase [Mn], mitochondrial [Entomortierella chlamydospora]|uniref:Superoxide dismutase n=1 Tax=Entomortierella chlamydospora TaxID=101097 RepID=A0A9P6SWG6_9FUNG|nr:Superoxide dismutase [Mn], mitochondrial [Entomortierella chlamydospora]